MREVALRGDDEARAELDARDVETERRHRSGGLPGRAPDFEDAVAGLQATQLYEGVVEVGRVLGAGPVVAIGGEVERGRAGAHDRQPRITRTCRPETVRARGDLR